MKWRASVAQETAEQRRKTNLAHAREPAVTLDGTHVEVLANIGGLNDARRVAELGGEGVGLLRSEFLFMERRDAPSEQQQFETYKSIVEAIGPDRPIIIRTLDVGGDKPLAYLPIPKEDNPFLGERGVRVGLDRPEILRTQLRAILRRRERQAEFDVSDDCNAQRTSRRESDSRGRSSESWVAARAVRDHGRSSGDRHHGGAIRAGGGFLLHWHK